jgi:hypothetical protein
VRTKKIVTYFSKGIERRVDNRLELSLPITLLDHRVRSQNISSGGLYFIVTSDDIEAYSPGNTSPVEVVTSVSTPGLPSKSIKLTGSGIIIRVDKIDINHNNGKKFGVALKFSERLKISV